MTLTELNQKRDEAIRYAIKKLFTGYVDKKLGELDFNPYGWQPDPQAVIDHMWDYQPFATAVDSYCREQIASHVPAVKEQVREEMQYAREVEQTNQALTSHSI